MAQDWIFADKLGMYIVAKVDGKKVSEVYFTSRKPEFPSAGTPFARALERYAATGREAFEGFKPDLEQVTPFSRQVLEALFKVPPGTTVTYGELAARAGSPGAARAVGNVMARNPVPLLVPCHRVVATNGLGGFTGGLEIKRKLLGLEGVGKP